MKFAPGRFIDELTRRLGELGLGAFGWPLTIGVGAGTGLYALAEPRFAQGLLKHRASAEFLRPTLVTIAVSTVLVTASSLLVAYFGARAGGRRDRRSFEELYNLNLRRLAFLTASPLVVALNEPLESTHAWLALAFAGASGVFAAYSAYHWAKPVSADPRVYGVRRWWAPMAVAGFTVTYAVVMTRLAITNHLAFNTGRSDLGYYMSIFRQSSQGIPLGCSLCGGTHLTGHFDPILILLSPLYLLYPWSETLLVLQSVWLAAGAIPVYLLGRHHVKHRGVSVALAVCYLTYPALHGVNLFDFHSLSLAGPLFIWLLYFLQTGQIRAYYITLPFLLLVREDTSLALILVAIGSLFSKDRERARTGLVTIAVSVVYFLIAKGVFMGHLDPLNSDATNKGYAQNFQDVIPSGQATGGLLGTVIGDPAYTLLHILTEEKFDYILKIGVPVLFIPLLARERLLLVYGAAFTLLSTAPFLHSIHFQYSTLLIPFVFALSASALGRLASQETVVAGVSSRKLSHALAVGMLASTLLCSWKFGAFLPNGSFHSGFRPLARTADEGSREYDAWLRTFARTLPKGAKVAANTRIIPHLGIVTSVLMIDDRRTADYVIANISNKDVGRLIKPEMKSGELVQIAAAGETRIFRTNYKPASPDSKPRAPVETE